MAQKEFHQLTDKRYDKLEAPGQWGKIVQMVKTNFKAALKLRQFEMHPSLIKTRIKNLGL